MDYRHTEDFARRMEAAQLRAHALHDAAVADALAALGRAVRRGWHAAVARWARSHRADKFLPEA